MSDPGNLHESFDRRDEVKGSSDRAFGIVFTVVFALVGAWPLLHGNGLRLWSLAVAAAFLLAALVRPGLLAPLNRLWMKFGLLLHRITNPLIMGLVFFVAVVPTGLVMRLRGKDPLRLRFDREARSYWIDRKPPGPDPDTMRNQF